MSSARCFFLALSSVLCLLSCFLLYVFFYHVRKFAEPGMEEGAIEACQMDDLLYPERSIHHLDFSPIKGIFLHTVVRLPVHFSLIDFVIKSLLKCVRY